MNVARDDVASDVSGGKEDSTRPWFPVDLVMIPVRGVNTLSLTFSNILFTIFVLDLVENSLLVPPFFPAPLGNPELASSVTFRLSRLLSHFTRESKQPFFFATATVCAHTPQE